MSTCTRRKKKVNLGKVDMVYINRLRGTVPEAVKEHVKTKNDISKQPFIKYVQRNIIKFVNVLHNATATISSSMKLLDNRMDIGQLVVMSLVYDFEGEGNRKTISRVENNSYDFVFRGRKCVNNISVKSCSSCIKKIGKRGYSLKTNPIIVKNGMNNNNKVRNDEWHYLLAIQPQNIDENEKFCIGIASFNSAKKVLARHGSQTAEVKCRFNLGDWDFVYEHPEFLPDKDTDKIDEIYLKTKGDMYRKLLSFQKNKIFVVK